MYKLVCIDFKQTTMARPISITRNNTGLINGKLRTVDINGTGIAGIRVFGRSIAENLTCLRDIHELGSININGSTLAGTHGITKYLTLV